MQQLTAHPGWPVLVDYMYAYMNPLKKALLNGFMNDHDEYLKRAFECVGVHKVLDAPGVLAEMVTTERKRRGERHDEYEDES